jgi:zinc transporter ZupT
MNFRKFIAILAAIAAFPAAGSLVAIVADNFLGDFTRILVLFSGFIAASFVYNLIKGDEPEIKEKQGITSKEISEKLAEMRNKGN